MPRKSNPSPRWPEHFLAAYRTSGNISHSATLARVDRRTVQRRCHSDPEFAKDMEDAQEEAGDALEQEARRRAVEGTARPVFYKGDKIGDVREYSDNLLIVLLQAARPEKYRSNARVEHMGTGGGPVPVAIREMIIERPAPLSETIPVSGPISETTGEQP